LSTWKYETRRRRLFGA